MKGYLGSLLLLALVCQNLTFCWSLNDDDEGLGVLKSEDEVITDSYSRRNVVSSRLKTKTRKFISIAPRKLLAENLDPFVPFPNRFPNIPPFPPRNSPAPSPTPSPSPSPNQSPFPSPSPSPSSSTPPEITPPSPSPVSSFAPASAPSPAVTSRSTKSSKNDHKIVILVAAIGGSALLLISVIGIAFFQHNKMAVVKPWATGISGQLQKAFVTGVPKLRRSELETASEDFSNVIGSSSVYTLYKGTLSSGVEIAVVSLAMASAKDWSRNQEAQFRKKIDTLSKINHKNFVNLIGYCEEEEPFTRMMVFEYAPNGTLFEHLHIREAEHLDWVMRMRIAMGMAYCLEHLHNLSTPLYLENLNSSAVYLSDDYAAKMSDLVFQPEATSGETKPDRASNVYSFGVILFEMMTGRLPYSDNSSSLEDWASHYLRGSQSVREMVDPTLESFEEDRLDRIGEVIRLCVDPQPRLRPSMKEVSAMLRDITGIGPDGAIPKVSPLWWAELEIMTSEAS